MAQTIGSLDLNAFNDLHSDLTQYFWFEPNASATYGAGAHVTLVPDTSFISNPTGQNILMNTDGFSIRNGLLPMMTLDNDSLDFNVVDTTAGTYNKVASFGTTTTIGDQSGAHLELAPTRMYGMNSDLVDYFEIKNNAIDVGTNYEYKQTVTLSTTSTVITLYGAGKIYDSQEIGSFDDYPDAGKIGLSMHTADDFYPFEFTFGESNTQTYSTEDNILITVSYNGDSEFTLTSTDDYECTPTFIYSFLEIAPSYSFGNDNHSNNPYSVTIGANNRADSRCAIAIGGSNRADEEYAVAIGLGNRASGYCSYAEGGQTRASGHYAHAEGSSTVAGYTAHAEGYNTIASGQYSHVEGYNSIARGTSSHAGGSGAIAAKDNQTVIGKYNVIDTETEASKQQAFIIGNGVSGSNRSNALTVDWSGNVNIASGALYHVNGAPISDFVVEQGTSGNWSYRKYNSGIYEAWYTGTNTFAIDGRFASNSPVLWYGATQNLSLPFAVTSIQYVDVKAFYSNWGVWTAITQADSGGIKYQVFSALARTSATYAIRGYIKGTYSLT